jgi:hypothetical protein
LDDVRTSPLVINGNTPKEMDPLVEMWPLEKKNGGNGGLSSKPSFNGFVFEESKPKTRDFPIEI